LDTDATYQGEGRMLITSSDATALTQLNWMWEKSHRIEIIEGIWRAIPHDAPDDPDAVLVAEDPWSLRMLLREDAAERHRRS
jgi:hypothetical protein